MAIERATARDLPAVLALLERLDLPVEGVAQCLGRMVVARDDGHVVGAAAVELYAQGALSAVGRGRSRAIKDRVSASNW